MEQPAVRLQEEEGRGGDLAQKILYHLRDGALPGMTPAARLNTITYMEDHWSELQKIKEALRVPGGRATLPGD